MADVIPNNQFGIYRVGRVTLRRDSTDSGKWLISVPQHVNTAVNKSTALNFGTSFDHNSAITCWMLGSGTYAGVSGTAIGIFFGTSING